MTTTTWCGCPICPCSERIDPCGNPRVELSDGPAYVCIVCLLECL